MKRLPFFTVLFLLAVAFLLLDNNSVLAQRRALQEADQPSRQPSARQTPARTSTPTRASERRAQPDTPTPAVTRSAAPVVATPDVDNDDPAPVSSAPTARSSASRGVELEFVPSELVSQSIIMTKTSTIRHQSLNSYFFYETFILIDYFSF